MEAPYDTSRAPGAGTGADTVTPADPAAAAPPVRLTVRTPDAMRELGRRLARLLRPGDLVLLTGQLGAGKTTLARGLGEGLNVRGAVTSPTFVIARVHPPLGAGPALVHVDAYRLSGGLDEMEDLDLDVSLPESVVVVEWGEGRMEGLSEDRLHVVIERAEGADGPGPDEAAAGDDVREVSVTGVGHRWAAAGLSSLMDLPGRPDGPDGPDGADGADGRG
ncbi:tRNA (adenosine(37)-N6)-threonylcarbamoyltransferase complex ATPase subunit type 1 TsaE [Streptomyces xinghaiensis]|uniref:tRNA (adenosine(37)-N6)-threonylcarbamoyltransferase complex ATPase subunit type 1 TsaE n=1 Tax=Streptomyces xinghaiensis TaxID=1038928 RepID=UPI00379B0B38